ncbi:hypothetical protein CR513_28376, partial [Mucuna pruriens]
MYSTVGTISQYRHEHWCLLCGLEKTILERSKEESDSREEGTISSNGGDKNALQQLLQVVTNLQEKSEEQTHLNVEVVKRHEEVERNHEEAIERAGECKLELKEQLDALKARLIGLEEAGQHGEIRTRAKKHVEVEEDKEDRPQVEKEVPMIMKKANQGPQGKPQYQCGNDYRLDTRVDHYTPLNTMMMCGLDSMIPSSTTIAMDDGDDSPLLARTLRFRSTRVRWCSNRSPLITFGFSTPSLHFLNQKKRH